MHRLTKCKELSAIVGFGRVVSAPLGSNFISRKTMYLKIYSVTGSPFLGIYQTRLTCDLIKSLSLELPPLLLALYYSNCSPCAASSMASSSSSFSRGLSSPRRLGGNPLPGVVGAEREIQPLRATRPRFTKKLAPLTTLLTGLLRTQRWAAGGVAMAAIGMYSALLGGLQA